ncbi:hypothetical protein PMAYCL1PPCAC_21594 [Pristionchus mayeri]|uniref:Uncharacterized protein n=1 Tax=Pristionchus mayeri TaxID=1317129 RepID=A0AAN5CWD4_9BILA|nr:hypothetical protein PMAYCL1PPCAC_21594 [Pristionchus mayeri]
MGFAPFKLFRIALGLTSLSQRSRRLVRACLKRCKRLVRPRAIRKKLEWEVGMGFALFKLFRIALGLTSLSQRSRCGE